MRSPFHFLVTPLGGKRYDNTKTIAGKEFIMSSSQEDHTATNRFGSVVEVPLNYSGEIQKGDTLLVHHNVFRKYYDTKGRETSGPSFFMDDLFLIDNDQFFLYKTKEGWKAPNPYCFISPIKKTEKDINIRQLEKELLGTIRYTNSVMDDMGLSQGDVVSFQPESEYEFTVDGEKIYRMFTKNICILLENGNTKD